MATWCALAFNTINACADQAREQTDFFEKKIRPVLVKHCYECHASDSEEIGGKLLLDSRAGMITGGESGSVITSGKPEESLLMQALRYDGIEMPPSGRLPESVLGDFAKWIEQGAIDPRTGASVRRASDSEDLDALWSFQPRSTPAVPAVLDQSWSRGPLDQFVLARIEAADLKPAADAAPHVLVRRLYFDLTGLRPTTEQVADFVQHHERDP